MPYISIGFMIMCAFAVGTVTIGSAYMKQVVFDSLLVLLTIKPSRFNADDFHSLTDKQKVMLLFKNAP